MFKLNCNYCGAEVEREKNVSYACCFNCRLERNRKTAIDYGKHQRKLKKLNIKQQIYGKIL